MRLISWNVMQGGGKRVPAHVTVLQARCPDVVALQEVTLTTVAQYRELLARIGLSYAIDSFELAPTLSTLTGPRRYGLLLASHWPLHALPPADFPVPWTERVLSAVLAFPWRAMEIHTTHIPPGSVHGWLKISMLEGIYERLAKVSSVPRVLCGDFNTPQQELANNDVITWGQKKRADGSYGIPPGRERWDRGERNVLVALAQADLPDVFRLLHGYEVREFSWYWKGKGRQIGRRFDHVFASRQLNPICCQYLHAPQMDRLSDHAPIEVVFEPNTS